MLANQKAFSEFVLNVGNPEIRENPLPGELKNISQEGRGEKEGGGGGSLRADIAKKSKTVAFLHMLQNTNCLWDRDASSYFGILNELNTMMQSSMILCGLKGHSPKKSF
jgi:hypothetical protein